MKRSTVQMKTTSKAFNKVFCFHEWNTNSLHSRRWCAKCLKVQTEDHSNYDDYAWRSPTKDILFLSVFLLLRKLKVL